jgi:hypothetical protein
MGDICICDIVTSEFRAYAIPELGFAKMPLSNVNTPLQCLVWPKYPRPSSTSRHTLARLLPYSSSSTRRARPVPSLPPIGGREA